MREVDQCENCDRPLPDPDGRGYIEGMCPCGQFFWFRQPEGWEFWEVREREIRHGMSGNPIHKWDWLDESHCSCDDCTDTPDELPPDHPDVNGDIMAYLNRRYINVRAQTGGSFVGDVEYVAECPMFTLKVENSVGLSYRLEVENFSTCWYHRADWQMDEPNALEDMCDHVDETIQGLKTFGGEA